MTHFASQSHVGAALTLDAIFVLCFVFFEENVTYINRETNLILFLIWMSLG